MTEVLTPNAATGIAGPDDVPGGRLDQRRIFHLEGTPGLGTTVIALQVRAEGARALARALVERR